MSETPIETARRVWPGEWRVIKLGFLQLPGLWLVVSNINVRVYKFAAREWVSEYGTGGVYRTAAQGEDLEAVLIAARDKVRAEVAELARAVGLEVAGG